MLRSSTLVSLFVSLFAAGCGEAIPGQHNPSPIPVAPPIPDGGSSTGQPHPMPNPASDGGAPDAALSPDAGGGPAACACDVTELCDEGCSCDVACTVAFGPSPLGKDARLLGRAETAVYFGSTPLGDLDSVTVRDDGWTPDADGGLTGSTPPAPPFGSIMPPTPRKLGARRAVVAADVDGAGHDEMLVATDTQLLVDGWQGPAGLAPDAAWSWPAADAVDLAAGDLTGDGTPEIVVAARTGATVQVTVLSLPGSGPAQVIGQATVPGVARDAVGIGDVDGDGQVDIVLANVASSPGNPIGLTVLDFDSSGALSASPWLGMGADCDLSNQNAATTGADAAVADLNHDGKAEVIFAFICGDGNLELGLHDTALSKNWLTGSYVGRGAGAFLTRNMPLTASLVVANLRQSGEALEDVLPGRFAVTWTTGSDQAGPSAHLAVFDYEPARTQPDTIQLLGEESLADPNGLATAQPTIAAADVDLDGADELVVAASLVEWTSPPVNPFLPNPVPGFGAAAGTAAWELDPAKLDQLPSPTSIFRVAFADPSLPPQTPPLQTGFAASGPLVAMGDVDADGIRVHATGQILRRTAHPLVNAVLAAPPTWRDRPGVEQPGVSLTAFGTTDTNSVSDSQQITATAELTATAEGEFLEGFVKIHAGLTLSSEASRTTTQESSVSVGTETSTGPESDLVVYRVTPYASHVYEILSHPDPSQRGHLMTIDVPGKMFATATSLAQFRSQFGAFADDVIPPSLFVHTIGNPLSYEPSNHCNGDTLQARIGTGTVDKPFPSGMVDVGNSPSGNIVQKVTFGSQTSQSDDLMLGVKIEAGYSVGGFGLDTSAGLSKTWTHETTIGRDVEYTGAVANIADAGYTADNRYMWGICVFNFTNADNQASYPVISYVVDGAR